MVKFLRRIPESGYGTELPTKSKRLVPWIISNHSVKFHKDSIGSFRAILLIDKQTDRQTDRQTDTGENITSLSELTDK